MTVLVIDASITMAWILADESDRLSAEVLAEVVENGALVPSLWRLEVANALRNAVRRGRCEERMADLALGDLRALPIDIDAETDARAWNDTLRLSRSEDLTLYDAAYLELAHRRSGRLASVDQDLVAAAGRRGIEVVA